MSEDSDTRPVAPPDATGSPGAESESAPPQNAETFLERTKQAILTAIEETIRRHGGALLAEVRQTLQAAVEGLVAAQVEKMVEQLKPGGDTARRVAEGWLRELREFADATVGDLFDQRVPEYSRRAGQWVIDYALAGSLFAIAAVLLFVGGILALHELGVPAYAATLACGVVALGFGYWLLRSRARRPVAPGVTGEVRPPGG
jgi:hypothetical protein